MDSSHGAHVQAQVWNQFRSPVVSPVLDDPSSFWLLAAFSRSRFKLTEQSVGVILHSILGGSATSFAVLQVEDGIFKFSVIRPVGLFIYKLNAFECPTFKVFFHLWNAKGISFAQRSVLSDSGPSFAWTEVKSKKSARKPSSVPARKVFTRIISNLQPPKLKKPTSVFSRLNFSSVSDQNLGACPREKVWVPKSGSVHVQGDEHGINLDPI